MEADLLALGMGAPTPMEPSHALAIDFSKNRMSLTIAFPCLIDKGMRIYETKAGKQKNQPTNFTHEHFGTQKYTNKQ